MKLSELYQEEPESTVSNNGKQYQLNTLFKRVENNEIINFKVDELKWILQYTETQPERVKNADLSSPILVVKEAGLYIVIDGAHRLTKAVEDGVKQIPGILVAASQLNFSLINILNSSKNWTQI